MADDRLHEAMIKKAMGLARKGEGYTSPNPIVGAVVFDREGVIATGYHRKAGTPHAECEALRKAGERARGASIAVNLEPCCHHGRTGPCTEAIIKAGIRKVVFSIEDPFPQMRGKGAKILTDHGIRVISGVCREAATRLNEVYLSYVTTGRPFVVLKMAQSLDGRIAARNGDSRWISCPEALDFGHRLRARYDAIAVGSGTARADNPRLTVRRVRGRNPLRIVVTTSSHLPKNLKLFTENEDGKSVVVASREAIASGRFDSVTSWPVRTNKNGLDLADLLKHAGTQGVTSVLFEGGGQIATSLIRQKLVDKMFLLIAPLIIGDGIQTIGDLGVAKVSAGIRFRESGFSKLGADTLFWGYPEK